MLPSARVCTLSTTLTYCCTAYVRIRIRMYIHTVTQHTYFLDDLVVVEDRGTADLPAHA